MVNSHFTKLQWFWAGQWDGLWRGSPGCAETSLWRGQGQKRESSQEARQVMVEAPPESLCPSWNQAEPGGWRHLDLDWPGSSTGRWWWCSGALVEGTSQDRWSVSGGVWALSRGGGVYSYSVVKARAYGIFPLLSVHVNKQPRSPLWDSRVLLKLMQVWQRKMNTKMNRPRELSYGRKVCHVMKGGFEGGEYHSTQI